MVYPTAPRGFLSLTRAQAPDELSDLLNDYFACLFAVIEKRGGIVTDVVGDGYFETGAKTGSMFTRDSFGDVQLVDTDHGLKQTGVHALVSGHISQSGL